MLYDGYSLSVSLIVIHRSDNSISKPFGIANGKPQNLQMDERPLVCYIHLFHVFVELIILLRFQSRS